MKSSEAMFVFLVDESLDVTFMLSCSLLLEKIFSFELPEMRLLFSEVSLDSTLKVGMSSSQSVTNWTQTIIGRRGWSIIDTKHRFHRDEPRALSSLGNFRWW